MAQTRQTSAVYNACMHFVNGHMSHAYMTAVNYIIDALNRQSDKQNLSIGPNLQLMRVIAHR